MSKILILLLSLLLVRPGFAALDFNGSTDKILATTAIVTAAPFTACAWVNGDVAVAGHVFSVGDTASGTNYFTFHLKTAGAVEWWTNATAGGSVAVASPGTWSLSTWHHVCGYEESATSRAIFLDGGNKVTETTSRTPASIDASAIGIRKRSTEDGFFNGRIAEFAIWNRALSDAEVLSLSKGYSPNCFKNGLENYTDLVRDVRDAAWAIAWTTTGTTVAAHPRIVYCH